MLATTEKRDGGVYPTVHTPLVNDERIAAMTVKELKLFIESLGGDLTGCVEVSDLRQRAYELFHHSYPTIFDVMTEDPEIDNMTAKQLKDYIAELGGDSSDCFEMSDLRLRAFDLKCAVFGGVTEDGFMFSSPWAGFDDDPDFVDGEAFYAAELAAAIATGDDAAINRAILTFFLQENEPARLGEVDALLQEYKGREEELFVTLAKTQMERSGLAVPVSSSSGAPAPSAAAPSAAEAPRPKVTFFFVEPTPDTATGAEEATATTTTTTTTTPAVASEADAASKEKESKDDTSQTQAPPTTIPRRRSSYVVGGVRRGSEWEVVQAASAPAPSPETANPE